jgi:hypothetical protein
MNTERFGGVKDLNLRKILSYKSGLCLRCVRRHIEYIIVPKIMLRFDQAG